MQLRGYQEAACESVRSGWSDFRKQLGVLSTGGGKTIIFSRLAADLLPQRTLILCHREELVDQAIQKLATSAGVWAQKEKAEHSARLSAGVVVASVQTMQRRLGKWPANHFELVVCDEAHHAISESWQTVLRHFDRFAKVLGVTATPDRGDKRNLGGYFENIAFDVGLLDLINDGFLSRIAVKSVPLQIDLTGVKQSAGDFDAGQLGDVLAPYLPAIVRGICQHAAGRRVFAFLPLIATSKRFVEVCQSAGLRAEHVDGESADRKDKLGRFASGETELLSNAMLLTEGYDCPPVDCIVNLRPTRSRPLYAQIVGRGTRVSSGKENLLLLDFLWLHEKHNLIRPAHLLATSQQEADAMTELAAKSGGQGELDLEGLASTAQRNREEALRQELEAQAKRKARFGDAIEFCLSLHATEAAEWEDTMGWHGSGVSEKQAAFLSRHGIDPLTVKSKGHASAVIDLIMGRFKQRLATPKQLKYLRQFGHPAPEKATMQQASDFLDSHFGHRPKWEKERVAA